MKTETCKCGCGEPCSGTYVQGHNRRGITTQMKVVCPCGTTVLRKRCLVESGRAKYCSIGCRQRFAPPKDVGHPAWKGEDVGNCALHDWVKRYRTKPDACEWCHSVEPLDWANLSQTYVRDLYDWAALCRRCHSRYDRACRYDSNPFCANGHMWTPESTYSYNGNRRCRVCINESSRLRRSTMSIAARRI